MTLLYSIRVENSERAGSNTSPFFAFMISALSSQYTPPQRILSGQQVASLGIPASQTLGDTPVLGNIPADADFSQIGSAINSGGSEYWYKTTYFNSVTLAETNLTQSFAARGGGYGHLVAVEVVRLEAGLQNANHLDASVIAERRDQAEDEVLGRLAAAGYVIPLQASNGSLYVPPMIEGITRSLAAGFLMIREFGEVAEEDSKDGKAKITHARDMLDDIQAQKIVLVDTVGASRARSSQVSGWPDVTTALVGTDGRPEPFQMRMSKRF
jgi:hypothetical protein